jgi:hypothetical protein
MNYKERIRFYGSSKPLHKTRVSPFIDGNFKGYACSDGALTQYGYTKEQAIQNYWNARQG